MIESFVIKMKYLCDAFYHIKKTDSLYLYDLKWVKEIIKIMNCGSFFKIHISRKKCVFLPYNISNYSILILKLI